MPRPLVSELPAGVAWGQAGPAEVLALRYELGCLFAAISLGLLQAVILSLRIADGLCQHLAQLGFRLRRFARRFPLGHILGHAGHMGMRWGDLNPIGRLLRGPEAKHHTL